MFHALKAGRSPWALWVALITSGCSSPVVRHARDGRLPELRSALEAGKTKPKHLNKALCEAASRGHPGATRLLLENGADIEGGKSSCPGRGLGCSASATRTCSRGLGLPRGVYASNIGCPTPLGCAAMYGHGEVVELLLSLAASTNVERSHANRVGRWASPLVLAAIHGDPKTLKLLLKARADPLYASVTNFSGYLTAYEWAESRGNDEAAAILKADMDARAARAGAPATAKTGVGGKLGFLKQVTSIAGGFVPGLSQVSDALEKVQTAVTVAEAGSAVYQAARPSAPAPVYAAVASAPPPKEPKLHEAADAGDVGRMRLALAAGADVNEPCTEGATALMHAAAVGSAEAVKVLLGAKAGVNAANAEGVTALMAAVLSGRREAIEALLASGADPNLKAKSGGTALSLAEAAGNQDIAAALKQAGAR